MPHNLEPLFIAAVEALKETGTDYLIYGGIAAGMWGEPRYTEDIDFVLFVPEREFHLLLRAAARHGFHGDEDLNTQQLQISAGPESPSDAGIRPCTSTSPSATRPSIGRPSNGAAERRFSGARYPSPLRRTSSSTRRFPL